METNVMKIEKLTSNVNTDIEKAAIDVFYDIKEMVENTTYNDNGTQRNKYEFRGELDFSVLCAIDASLINQLGVRDRKRFKRLINKCGVSKSLRHINRFIHFIATKILKTDKRVHIIEPRHNSIQDKRTIWLDLKAKADQALADYKALKGDYYKTDLEN